MKRLFVLGATGSIGTQTLDIVRSKPDEYHLEAFSFNENLEKAILIIEEFKPNLVSTPSVENYLALKAKYHDIIITNDILDVVRYKSEEKQSFDCVINALVGSAGLMPSLETLKVERTLLLANKESLVMAGDLLKKEAAKRNVSIVPIDSEHSAILQACEKAYPNEISKLILTASGGSLYHVKKEDLDKVSIKDALNHPNWQMGAKITIDSATLMNKGFEVIEACYLFDVEPHNIEVVVHPESIVHSMVEFVDHAVIAQLAVSDMRIPILYALEHPHHTTNNLTKTLDFSCLTLHFEKLDHEHFPLVETAIAAFNKKGFYPAILNASNEAAVSLFLKGEITFDKISKIIQNACTYNWEEFENYPYDFEHIMKVDQYVKATIVKNLTKGGKYASISISN